MPRLSAVHRVRLISGSMNGGVFGALKTPSQPHTLLVVGFATVATWAPDESVNTMLLPLVRPKNLRLGSATRGTTVRVRLAYEFHADVMYESR